MNDAISIKGEANYYSLSVYCARSTGWAMGFFSSLYSKPESLWVSMRMPLLFLPGCPWSSLVNTSAPGLGDPSIFPTPSLWMTSPSYYSYRYHLRVRAFKFHDSPSKPWEEIPSCPLAMYKGYLKHSASINPPLGICHVLQLSP